MSGSGYRFFIMILFSARKSIQMRQVTSLFGTKTIGEPHGEVDGDMIPLFNNSWIFFFIYKLSMIDMRYIPIFKSGTSCCN